MNVMESEKLLQIFHDNFLLACNRNGLRAQIPLGLS